MLNPLNLARMLYDFTNEVAPWEIYDNNEPYIIVITKLENDICQGKVKPYIDWLSDFLDDNDKCIVDRAREIAIELSQYLAFEQWNEPLGS